MVPDLMGLSSSVDLGSHGVDWGAGVHVLPERLSVVWIITTGVVLFRTVVVEWNTSSGQSEGEGSLEVLIVVELILESGVIVVVNEDTEGINVLEFAIFFSESVFDVVHALSRSKNILDREVHWVVEQSGQVLLIWTNVV